MIGLEWFYETPARLRVFNLLLILYAVHLIITLILDWHVARWEREFRQRGPSSDITVTDPMPHFSFRQD